MHDIILFKHFIFSTSFQNNNVWGLFKWNLFAVLLANSVGCRWTHGCVHDTPAVNHELCNRMSILEWRRNIMTWLSAGIQGEESIQTGPARCDSIPWCRGLSTLTSSSVHSTMCNPLRPSYCHQQKALRHAHEGCHLVAWQRLPSCGLHCPEHAALYMLGFVGPSHKQPRPVIMWLPCVWPPSGKCYRAIDSVQMKTSRPQWCNGSSSSPGSSLHRSSIGWCISWIPVTMPMVTIKTVSIFPIPQWVSFEQASYIKQLFYTIFCRSVILCL
jgi:hypothetical protein